MIQKNELRIGNLIYYNSPTDGRIINEVYWHDLQWISENETYFYKHHKPIELTQEILSLCGFTEDIYHNFYIDLGTIYLDLMPTHDGFYPVIIEPAEVSSEFEQKVRLKKIHYIHQLQNLFYFLVGEELNTEKITI